MENKTFEQYLAELDNALKALENKDATLEESVANYTKGLELAKKCYEILDTNEKLVVKKMPDAGLADSATPEE